MPKLSFMKWYPADWINDTRELSPEAKAAWIDMLCLMWNAPQRGVWKGTYQEFARATGLPWEIAPRVVTELSHKTSRVTIRDNEVTLENRRMVNQETGYKSHANRQAEYRKRQASDKKVTDKTLDSSILLNTTTTKKTPKFTPPTPQEVKQYADSIQFPLDADVFLNYYAARGWQYKRGQPMKDWQAAVRTWKKNGNQQSQGGTAPSWM